ncbi:MAG: DMT family transporter [Alphaproteobacteria bacterium]|jgi:drug/metabolite transporter (DMT)-like permease
MPRSPTLQAILLMLLSMAGFSVMMAFIRELSATMHPTQMVLLRNVISFFMILLWCAYLHRDRKIFKTNRMGNHFWRATVGILSMELWFYSISIMPMTLATALSFTTPIFSTIIAMIFLGERAGLHRWGAIIVGFFGVLIILRPDVYGIDHKAMIVLLASLLMGISGVLVKTLTRTESPETIVFYMTLFMIPWSIVPALLHWQEISMYQWWLVFCIALFSTASHLTMTRAFKRVDLVILMPFDFTRLIFVSILGFMFFDEILTLQTALGALVIVASTVYITRHESRKNASSVLP